MLVVFCVAGWYNTQRWMLCFSEVAEGRYFPCIVAGRYVKQVCCGFMKLWQLSVVRMGRIISHFFVYP